MDAEDESALNLSMRARRQQSTVPPSLVVRDGPRMLATLLLVALATALCVAWIDLPLAQFMLRGLDSGATREVVQAKYPDVLDAIVAGVTLLSWIGYIVLRRHHAGTRFVCMLQVLGTAVPFSYTAKDLLKALFGRVNTRYWINHPYHFEFRWLHASEHFFGFPSGHLAIAAAIAFPIMHYYPRLRPLGWTVLLLLAITLLVSEYHFLGDLIAGAYIGYLAFVAARELPGAAPSR